MKPGKGKLTLEEKREFADTMIEQEAEVVDKIAPHHVRKYIEPFIAGERELQPFSPTDAMSVHDIYFVAVYRVTLRATIGAVIDVLRERGWSEPAPSLGDIDAPDVGPTLRWRGVWDEDATYRHGETVACSNALFVCESPGVKGIRPGAGAKTGWRLILKSPDMRGAARDRR